MGKRINMPYRISSPLKPFALSYLASEVFLGAHSAASAHRQSDPLPMHERTPQSQDKGEVTLLLDELRKGEPVSDALFRKVYDELHKLARHHRRQWKGNDTLNTTAIVHEAYLKLVGSEGSFENRKHFLATASKAMRHLLITYAERQSAQKRGGADAQLPLDEARLVPDETTDELLALDEALKRFEAIDPRAAEVVECRFFGGLDAEETADVLGVSRRTITRDWVAARAWLYAELTRESAGAASLLEVAGD